MSPISEEMFKAYDIRGVYPTEVNSEVIYAIGQAYAQLFSPRTVVVGHDVRTSGPELYHALIEGLTDAGVDVVRIGGISTEMMYFAVGYYGYGGGLTVTASHNPAEYNGLKMVKKHAEPVTGETGIFAMRDLIPKLLKQPVRHSAKGVVSDEDIFQDYRSFLFKFVDPRKFQPMTVVVNANFGLQGKFASQVLAGTPVRLSLLNSEPDGTFPKGRPDPFVPENRDEFVAKIVAERPDFGVAWDADADRCFFATGDGTFLEAYYMNAILAQALLVKHPGEKIIYDVRYTWAIIDAVTKAGGQPVKSRVGHSYIKQAMRKNNAFFCGESSGHYYFRDYFYSDTGMLPFLFVIQLLSDSGKSLADFAQPLLEKYFVSGEINSKVNDVENVLARVKEQYRNATAIDETDRLSIEYGRDWRANIRSSNTEPLLRLNVEAASERLMEEKRDELLALIRG